MEKRKKILLNLRRKIKAFYIFLYFYGFYTRERCKLFHVISFNCNKTTKAIKKNNFLLKKNSKSVIFPHFDLLKNKIIYFFSHLFLLSRTMMSHLAAHIQHTHARIISLVTQHSKPIFPGLYSAARVWHVYTSQRHAR